MGIQIVCPATGKSLTAPEHLAGREFRCPACGGVHPIPASTAPAAPPVPARPASPAGTLPGTVRLPGSPPGAGGLSPSSLAPQVKGREDLAARFATLGAAAAPAGRRSPAAGLLGRLSPGVRYFLLASFLIVLVCGGLFLFYRQTPEAKLPPPPTRWPVPHARTPKPNVSRPVGPAVTRPSAGAVKSVNPAGSARPVRPAGSGRPPDSTRPPPPSEASPEAESPTPRQPVPTLTAGQQEQLDHYCQALRAKDLAERRKTIEHLPPAEQLFPIFQRHVGQISQALILSLEDDADANVREAALRQLTDGQYGTYARAALLERLRTTTSSAVAERLIQVILAHQVDLGQAVKVLTRRLEPADPKNTLEVRRLAVIALGRMGTSAAVQVLRAQFDRERDGELRGQILARLARFDPPAARKLALASARDRSAGEALRSVSLSLLSLNLGGAEHAALYREMLTDRSSALVRLSAAWALTRNGLGAEARPTLRRLLQEKNADLMIGAIQALRLLEDRDSLPRLKALCKHENAAVREAAQEAVKVLEVPPPSPASKPPAP